MRAFMALLVLIQVRLPGSYHIPRQLAYWLKSESEADVCLWHWIRTHADFDVKFPE